MDKVKQENIIQLFQTEIRLPPLFPTSHTHLTFQPSHPYPLHPNRGFSISRTSPSQIYIQYTVPSSSNLVF